MKDAKQSQPESPLKGPAKPAKGDDDAFLDNPNSELEDAIAANQAAYVEETATLLDTNSIIRTRVFAKLREKQREDLDKDWLATKENARHPAFSLENLDASTAATKKKALATIRAEINGLQGEIDKNKRAATKLMNNAVQYAKDIGDRLFFVKWNLLKHGEYEDWVEENFDGGVSTARAYTRIAKLENWRKITPKLYGGGGLTLEQALALIRERPKEKEPSESRKEIFVKVLVDWFRQRINFWPIMPLSRLAYDSEFMDLVDETAKQRNAEIRRAVRERRAKSKEKMAMEGRMDSKEFLAVLRKRFARGRID